jgi:hypothetical protein
MSRMELAEGRSILARTPSVLDAMLAGLSPDWVERDDGPGTWSAYDIVGHLLNGDTTDWVPRVRLILAHGATQPFVPVDREAMLGWEREPADALLARFRSAREANLDALSALVLDADDLARPGLHPVFGAVTLGQLLATWVAHDLTHLAQVGEVLARRYRDDVGPWRAYLPALDRTVEAE